MTQPNKAGLVLDAGSPDFHIEVIDDDGIWWKPVIDLKTNQVYDWLRIGTTEQMNARADHLAAKLHGHDRSKWPPTIASRAAIRATSKSTLLSEATDIR